MLTRAIVSASLAVFVATQAPAMLAPGKAPETSAPQPVSVNTQSEHSVSTTLTAMRDGHFGGKFLINGHPVTGIVDTGATFVALSELSARDVGIDASDLVYDHTVATATGDIKAARVRLASLAIGDVSLSDVDALVVRNDALPAALIGMSFLARLSSFAVAADTMRLVE